MCLLPVRHVQVAGTNCKMDHRKFKVNMHIKLNESNTLHESILYQDLEENHCGDLFPAEFIKCLPIDCLLAGYME